MRTAKEVESQKTDFTVLELEEIFWYIKKEEHRPTTNTKHLHEYNDLPFSIFDLL